MTNKYISRDEDISRLTKIFKEETKDGIDKEFTICPSQYKQLNSKSLTIYEHLESINKLAEDGLIKIIDSWPQIDEKAPGFVGPFVYKILVFANQFKEQTDNQQTPTETATLKRNLPPKEWRLVEKDKKAFLQKNGQTIYEFPTDWSQKYKYFKCLWNYYDQYVPNKQIYEYESKLKYPEKGITKTNRNIRSVFTKFNNEIKKLPISIEIKKGAKLTFIS